MNEHLFLQQVVSSQRVTPGSIALLSDNYMLLVSSYCKIHPLSCLDYYKKGYGLMEQCSINHLLRQPQQVKSLYATQPLLAQEKGFHVYLPLA